MALTIDTLEIQIQTDAKKVTNGLNRLAKSLGELKNVVGNSSNLVSNLTQISKAIQSFSSVGKINIKSKVNQLSSLKELIPILGGSEASQLANNLREIASAMTAFSTVPKLNVNVSSLASGIRTLNEASASFDGTRLGEFSAQMQGIANGLSNLSGIGRTNLSSIVNSLKKIPDITKSLDTGTLDAFATTMGRLTEIMTPLGTQMDAVARGFNSLPKSILRAINATNKQTTANNKLNKSYGGLFTNLSRTAARFWTLYYSVSRVADMFADWFGESNEYIEALNLFNVSMGDAAGSAMEFAESVREAMGINVADWITNQGAFMRMSTGFGVSADKAELMSKNLTQLAYDMSSFFNADLDTAMKKLQSGMTGQIKGLKEWGFNLSVAALQETALSLGIEQKVRTMTEAQKAQLRYITLIQRSNGIMGDMARTIHTPSNAMRIFSAQIEQMRRALGNLVSMVITKLIPYIQAFVELVTEAAESLAEMWGFELPSIDYSGLDLAADIMDDVDESVENTEEGISKLKKQLMGFDELNILQNPKADADETTEPSYDLGIELPEYDFMNGFKGVNLEPYKEKLLEILDVVKDIAIGFATWKIGTGILNFFTLLKTSGVAGIVSKIGGALSSFAQNFDLFYTSGAGAFGSFKKAVQQTYKEIPKLAKVLLGSAGLVAGLILSKNAGYDLAEALANDNKGLGGALGKLVGGVGLGVAGGAMVGGPVGAVIGGLATLASALYGVGKKNEELSREMMDTVFFDDYGKSLDSVRKELEDSFSSIDNYIKKQEGLKKSIDNAKASAQEAKGDLDILFFELGTREELSNQDIEDLRQAFDDLYTTIDTMNTARFEMVTSEISQAIISGLAPAREELRGLAGELLELQNAFKIDYTNLQTEANSILDQLDHGNLDDATKTKYRARLQEIANEMMVYAYDVDPSDLGRKESYNRINLGGDMTEALSALSGIKDSVKTRVEGIESTRLDNLANIAELQYIANERGIDTGVDWSLVESTTTSNANTQMVQVLQEYANVLSNIGEEIELRFGAAVDDQIERWKNATMFSADWWTRPIGEHLYSQRAIAAAYDQYGGIIKEWQSQAKWLSDLAQKYNASVNIKYPAVMQYADGGFPTMGEMFIARESGPEMVGRIGNKSAVANNEQITAGIASAVYSAMMAANEDSSGNGNSNARIIVQIGEQTVGEAAVSYINGQIIQTGVNPIYV